MKGAIFHGAAMPLPLELQFQILETTLSLEIDTALVWVPSPTALPPPSDVKRWRSIKPSTPIALLQACRTYHAFLRTHPLLDRLRLLRLLNQRINQPDQHIGLFDKLTDRLDEPAHTNVTLRVVYDAQYKVMRVAPWSAGVELDGRASAVSAAAGAAAAVAGFDLGGGTALSAYFRTSMFWTGRAATTKPSSARTRLHRCDSFVATIMSFARAKRMVIYFFAEPAWVDMHRACLLRGEGRAEGKGFSVRGQSAKVVFLQYVPEGMQHGARLGID